MNQDELESQLSAMFDGELPAAECELLSRRIDRDDGLRARWSRYALIGAAMRCEPVATARGGFAARVSRALNRAGEGRSSALRGRSRYVWQCALAAGLVGSVAGLSLLMLRDVALQPASPVLRQAAVGGPVIHSPAYSPAHSAVVALRSSASAAAPAIAPGAPAGPRHEPYSYVTPANDAADPSALRTELVDYIVAHSQYSTPLMQPDLLSSLISGEDTADDGVHALDAAGAPIGATGASPPIASSAAAAAAPASAAADDANAPTAAPAASR